MNEAVYYNALAVATRSSYTVLRRLWNMHENWADAWKQYIQKYPTQILPEQEFEALEKNGVRFILKGSPQYPSLLDEIPLPPLGIYIKGSLSQPSPISIAIVGTRKATDSGKRFARKFASSLAENKCTIISGLAMGIDAQAHMGCLESSGYTIAVLGSGLDHIYPRINEKLAENIIEKGGAVLSEYPLGTPSLPYRFLERNRIISGLSAGVMIIEAPQRSGSLATARFAIEQNREVFVLPGPANHPHFAGSHQLIREGATLVTDPSQILEDFNIATDTQQNSANSPATKEEKVILEILKLHPHGLSIDKIVGFSKLNIQVINQTISFLLIKDVIKETEKGYSL